MPRAKKLYIDSDGVRRGFYVYLHKDRVTGEVFYVGKGHGNRAWTAHANNDKWKNKVAALVDGWEVEIVEQDLSEIDAFHLEAELVEKHGGCEARGGILTTHIPHPEFEVLTFPSLCRFPKRLFLRFGALLQAGLPIG